MTLRVSKTTEHYAKQLNAILSHEEVTCLTVTIMK